MKKKRIVVEIDQDTYDSMTEFCNKNRLQPEQLLSYLAPAIEASKEEENCAKPTQKRETQTGVLGNRRRDEID